MLSRAHNSLRLEILPLTLFDSRFCQQFLANPMIPISQGEGDPMPYFPNVPRCQHLKVNGTQCGSPGQSSRRSCRQSESCRYRRRRARGHIARSRGTRCRSIR